MMDKYFQAKMISSYDKIKYTRTTVWSIFLLIKEDSDKGGNIYRIDIKDLIVK